MLSNADLARLVMPLAIGLLIGLERGWQQRSAQPGSRVAGLRTFGLFGLIGGLAGFAAGMTQGWAVSAVLLLAGCALVIIGYRRDKSPSATTEAAALVTLGLGWLAGHGLPVPALALAVVTAFLLAQRARLHAWIEALQAGRGDDVSVKRELAAFVPEYHPQGGAVEAAPGAEHAGVAR